jgi:hypothetical protein
MWMRVMKTKVSVRAVKLMPWYLLITQDVKQIMGYKEKTYVRSISRLD